MTKVIKKNEVSKRVLKTNQILTRKMGNFEVLQRTKDGMFNATTLLKQWNVFSGQKKDVSHFFENSTTQEFISTMLSKENFTSRNSVYLKSRASRGENAGTWMHPFLFIDFAMWINAEFKYEVIKFVYDQLIEHRVDAGIHYKEVGRCVSNLVEKDFMKTAMQNVSRTINHVVFGRHESGIRNLEGCEFKIKELVEIEKNIVMLVDCGFVSTYDQLMSFLKREWVKKHKPLELS